MAHFDAMIQLSKFVFFVFSFCPLLFVCSFFLLLLLLNISFSLDLDKTIYANVYQASACRWIQNFVWDWVLAKNSIFIGNLNVCAIERVHMCIASYQLYVVSLVGRTHLFHVCGHQIKCSNRIRFVCNDKMCVCVCVWMWCGNEYAFKCAACT